jgi:hypothetical protein
MKKAGRILLPLIGLILLLIVGAVFFLMADTSPTSVANDFLVALAKGDKKGLANLGYIEGASESQAEDIWAKTLDRGEYFRFVWNIRQSAQSSPTHASVEFDLVRNIDRGATKEDDFQIPLIKIDGHWRVEVRGIPRGIYPGLPR